MKTYTEKEVRELLLAAMNQEVGRGISEADRTYKRGWRDCIRYLRAYLNDPQPQKRTQG